MALKRTRSPVLEAAFDNVEGGVPALAARLGISSAAIYDWDKVPAARCLEVERWSGVSRHILRPDIYGPPPRPKVRPASATAAA